MGGIENLRRCLHVCQMLLQRDSYMKISLTNDELFALKKLASSGGVYQPMHNEAPALSGLGFIESDGLGRVRITAEGLKYLHNIDTGVL